MQRISRCCAVAARFSLLGSIALLVACSTRESSVVPGGPPNPLRTNSGLRATHWGARVLITFQEGLSGGEPSAGLTRDRAGNLYGTTVYGGDQNCFTGFDTGCGVVFKIDPSGNESVVYAFPPPGGTDGRYPEGRVIVDRAGNLYGTTSGGGNTSCGGGDGCGTVFKIDKSGNESVLYRFNGGTDGEFPDAGVVRDSAGELYGTTYHGGGRGCHDVFGRGCGIVFKVSLGGTEAVLHRFKGRDGAIPVADLLLDRAGNLYGTTEYGGTGSCNDGFHTGCGAVFEIPKNGKLVVLSNFSGGAQDGAAPRAGLLRDSAGNLYGTAYYGGDVRCKYRPVPGCGVVFKIGPDRQGNRAPQL